MISTMHSSSVAVFFCCLLSQRFPEVACADVGVVDSIAIATSLALTAFIMAFLGYFLWRTQYRSATVSVTTETGRDNPAVSAKEAENGNVEEMQMAPPRPPVTQ